MRGFRAAIPAVLLASSIGGAPALAVTISFDDLPGMGNLPGTEVPEPNRLSDQLLASFGVRFASGSDFVAVVNHAPNPTPSLPNIIGGVNAAGELSYGSPVLVSFFDPANPSVKAFTDSVSIRGDMFPLFGATATLEAFDPAGALLGALTQDDTSAGLTLALSLPNIHSLRITQDSASPGSDGTIGLDDLTFGELHAVPEPATGLLALAGMVCLGVGRRR